MNDSIQDLLHLRQHHVTSLEAITSDSDAFKPMDGSIFPSEFFYTLRYSNGFREVSVYVHNVGDDETCIELVEKEETLLPKRGARLVAFSVMRNGKNVASINWNDLMVFTRERRAMVFVESAYDAEELVDVALEAAKLLGQQYETIYKESMEYAPLKGMILTELLR